MTVPSELVLRLSRRHPFASGPLAEAVRTQFGLPAGAGEPLRLVARFTLRPGGITLVTGPSGSGKSTCLAALVRRLRGGAIRADRPLGPRTAAVVDVLPGALPDRLRLLAQCGLAEARVLAGPVRALSEGERHRLLLARAVAHAEGRVIIVDRFLEGLDRLTAWLVALQVRRLVSQRSLLLVAATAYADLGPALQPDHTLVLGDDLTVEDAA
jgi:ABC-type ATPase with predicted acetyltransferase domain